MRPARARRLQTASCSAWRGRPQARTWQTAPAAPRRRPHMCLLAAASRRHRCQTASPPRLPAQTGCTSKAAATAAPAATAAAAGGRCHCGCMYARVPAVLSGTIMPSWGTAPQPASPLQTSPAARSAPTVRQPAGCPAPPAQPPWPAGAKQVHSGAPAAGQSWRVIVLGLHARMTRARHRLQLPPPLSPPRARQQAAPSAPAPSSAAPSVRSARARGPSRTSG